MDISLCNPTWLDILPESYYDYLPQDTSDHALMLINMLCKSNSGLKPFKFFNYWFQCAGSEEALRTTWNTPVAGSPMYQVVMKLKSLKFALKEWSKKGFSTPSSHVTNLREAFSKYTEELALNPMDPVLQAEEVQIQNDLAHWLDLEENMLRQKCKESWLQWVIGTPNYFILS